MVVRSTQVRRVESASREVGELLGQGVVLARAGSPTYSFTRLNDVKPPMLAEALAAARKGAEQFALESGSRLGGIRRANQGVFSIRPRDPGAGNEGQQVEKTVRVVSTIDYLLED